MLWSGATSYMCMCVRVCVCVCLDVSRGVVMGAAMGAPYLAPTNTLPGTVSKFRGEVKWLLFRINE